MRDSSASPVTMTSSSGHDCAARLRNVMSSERVAESAITTTLTRGTFPLGSYLGVAPTTFDRSAGADTSALRNSAYPSRR